MTSLLRVALLSVVLVSATHAQSNYDEQLLRIKQMFSDAENDALSKDYKGVATDAGLQSGLFPVMPTGVTTAPIMTAAQSFLNSLTSAQTIRTLFAIDDSEWRKWSNVDNGLYVRQGISLEEMTERQKAAAFALMTVSLSAKGLKLSADIMKTDRTLYELNNNSFMYGEEKYFFTVMGRPSTSEPWGWQLDGHHLVINYFVLGDQVVVTPMFLGAEPVVATTGKYAGNAVLQNEQDMGLELLQSLDSVQRDVAVLGADKSASNLLGGAGKDNLVLNYAGISSSELSVEQNAKLIELIGLFVGNIREDQAESRMQEVLRYIEETHFAWIGGTADDAVFYYRIHSPVILIEFDHQSPVGVPGLKRGVPTRQHVHVIVRTPNGNDYGKDLLRQHLAASVH